MKLRIGLLSCLLLLLSLNLFANEESDPNLFLLFDVFNEKGERIGTESYWNKKFKDMFVEYGYNPEMIIRSDFQKLARKGDLFVNLSVHKEKDSSLKHHCKIKL